MYNMGRRKQKERERKRAAAMSQSLQKFLPPKKKAAMNTEGDTSSESQTAAPSCDTLASHKNASSTADLSPEVSSEPAAA